MNNISPLQKSMIQKGLERTPVALQSSIKVSKRQEISNNNLNFRSLQRIILSRITSGRISSKQGLKSDGNELYREDAFFITQAFCKLNRQEQWLLLSMPNTGNIIRKAATTVLNVTHNKTTSRVTNIRQVLEYPDTDLILFFPSYFPINPNINRDELIDSDFMLSESFTTDQVKYASTRAYIAIARELNNLINFLENEFHDNIKLFRFAFGNRQEYEEFLKRSSTTLVDAKSLLTQIHGFREKTEQILSQREQTEIRREKEARTAA